MTLAALLRSSVRGLLRRPGYALLTSATLALGIGGSTAVFALVDGVLLESVPFPQADRLVTLDVESTQTGFGISLSIPNYRDLRDRSRVFSSFATSAGQGYVLTTDDGARQLDGRMVLGDFFALLGLEAQVGRVLAADETDAGAPATAVLGHGYWLRTTGGDPGVVGSAVVLDGTPHVVVGVLEPGSGYPHPDVEIYTPMGARAARLPWDDRDSSFGARALARLAPGVTRSAAQEDVDRVTREVDELEGRPTIRARVVGLEDFFLGDVRQGLGILMGAVLLVLLIAGANVANLALARSEARSRELAVRRALGASRGAVGRLLMAEALVLALVGGAAGLALAVVVVGGLPGVLPVEVPALVQGQIGVHGRSLLFALAVSLASGLVFGLAPGLGAVARGAGSWLREGQGGTGGLGGRRLRDGLVVAQVGLSVVLLVAAGLLLVSLRALSGVDKGFQEEGVLTASLQAPRGTFDGEEDWLAFNDGVLRELAATPEVEGTAMALLLPLTGRSWERRIWPEGTELDVETASSVLFNVVSEDYFEVLGVPLLRGRGFERSDRTGEAPVAVVDETMTERFWPGDDPLGRRIHIGGETDPDGRPVWRTVVGLVANTRHYELESPSRIQVYIPMRQPGRLAGIGLSVLAAVPDEASGAATESLRSLVARLEPGVPVSRVRTMEAYLADALGATRALGAVTGVFGVVATLLAGLGIFGVLSLTVARRRREIGVRMSLGATPASVVSLVVGRGMTLVGLGALAGAGAALLAGGAVEAFLFQVRPAEPGVFAAALGALGVVALTAVLRPALRAARTAPATALGPE